MDLDSSEMFKILKIVYPIIVVVVWFALSYVFYVLKLRGVLKFFVYSLCTCRSGTNPIKMPKNWR